MKPAGASGASGVARAKAHGRASEKAEGHLAPKGRTVGNWHRRPPPLSLMDGRPRAHGAAATRDEGVDVVRLVEHGRAAELAAAPAGGNAPKHEPGCAAGSATVSMGRADTVMNR
jgi:hypothetical protein